MILITSHKDLDLNRKQVRMLKSAIQNPVVRSDENADDILFLVRNGLLNSINSDNVFYGIESIEKFVPSDEGNMYLEFLRKDNRRFRLPMTLSITAILISIIAIIVSITQS